MKQKILVFQDSHAFGGHEIMLLRMLPSVLDDHRLSRLIFAYPERNALLSERLLSLDHPKLQLHPWKWIKRPAEPFLAHFRFAYAKSVRKLYKSERPDIVLIVQGRIENAVVPMLALPREARIVSYIPMAHSMAEIGLSPFPREMMRHRLYQRPNRFIVPSASVAAQLRRQKVRVDIKIVPNEVDRISNINKSTARELLGFSKNEKIALFLGRLDTQQKGLDLLAKAIKRDTDELGDWTFLIVGDGDGNRLMTDLGAMLRGKVNICIRNFTKDPAQYLAAADLLLLPSRWEGVPLVMLEAMAQRLPILASDIDVYTEYLPPMNRRNFAEMSLAAAIREALTPAAVAKYVAQARDWDKVSDNLASPRAFSEAVLG